MTDKINLNDLLHLDDLRNVKIRFNIMFGGNWNPIEIFKNNDLKMILDGHYWNFGTKKSYKEGQITIGFVRIKSDLWLLVHVGRITKDLNVMNGVGYEYETINKFKKYFGRLVIRFKNKSQTMIRLAPSVIHECEVYELLPDIFDNDLFPGYDNVNISWSELSRVIDKEAWKTALGNQKGIYLITDISNGKLYVGSATGQDMILGRWQSYIKSGHGGNEELKILDFTYIKQNFRFSILDIYKSNTDDNLIIERESWWKIALLSRKFGYNRN